MSQIPYQTAIDRIDADHYEESPSTGWRETAVLLGATAGAEHTPGSNPRFILEVIP